MAPALGLREAAATAAAIGGHMAAAASASGLGHVTKENVRWTGFRQRLELNDGVDGFMHCSDECC